MKTNIVVSDNVRTNYVTPFSFVDEGKKIGEGFVLPLTKYEQQGETEERERCRDAWNSRTTPCCNPNYFVGNPQWQVDFHKEARNIGLHS